MFCDFVVNFFQDETDIKKAIPRDGFFVRAITPYFKSLDFNPWLNLISVYLILIFI
jgi:hypothetical protein